MPTTSKSCFGWSVEIATVSPEREVLAIGGAGVEHDLSVALGPTALEQIERIEDGELRRRVDPEPEARSAVRVDGLAVLADDLGVDLVVDPAHRELDGVDTADLVEERGVDGRHGR